MTIKHCLRRKRRKRRKEQGEGEDGNPLNERLPMYFGILAKLGGATEDNIFTTIMFYFQPDQNRLSEISPVFTK